MYNVSNIMYMVTFYSSTSTGRFYSNYTFIFAKISIKKNQNLSEKFWKLASMSGNWFTRLFKQLTHF